jgi:outer membrane receptor for ferric coprogen and ferric-rhodotorulic acid
MLAKAQAQTQAQDQGKAETQRIESVVVTGKRANRVSKGATGLPLELKDTPQTISTLDKEDMTNFGLTSSNEALGLATGINVDQYETNRATFNSRGFDIQLTQLDGLGMTNSWGTVVGQLDTFLFDKIELVRGANGLLTGVGNASGTINYVRKRPTNEDGGEVNVTFGSWNKKRVALDYNKVLTDDGAWAGRLVVAREDKDSYLRDLHDKRTTAYGVVDGQIGDNGVLTAGITLIDSRQDSPMWGSLTLLRADGTQIELPSSTSTSQNWTYWNTRSYAGFVEYAHTLSSDWEAKATYNYRHGSESTKLLYASGSLNADNTGLYGWPYRSESTTDNHVLDVNLSGKFSAFGRKHSLVLGMNRSTEKTATDIWVKDGNCDATPDIPALPALPYGGNVMAEPDWGTRTSCSGGEQTLTRLYGASRLELTDSLKAIVGVNAMRHWRGGQSIYGSGGRLLDPLTKKLSPYVGLTYDITPDLLGYVSYSDIFLPQEQADVDGNLLAPVKGLNTEAGLKAEWLGKALLTTFAVFTAKQQGLATYGGINASGDYWYVPMDVKSKGFELEATGRLGKDARLTVGYTRLMLTGPDGKDIYEWVPRNTLNFRVDGRVPGLEALHVGLSGRWQSKAYKVGSVTQGAYATAAAFAAYDLNAKTTLRVNVNNLFDKKAIGGIANGAIYIPPRNTSVSLNYKF